MNLCKSGVKHESGLEMKLHKSGLKKGKSESGVKVHMVFAHGFKTHGGILPMVC
jgi:hypothetical protein